MATTRLDLKKQKLEWWMKGNIILGRLFRALPLSGIIKRDPTNSKVNGMLELISVTGNSSDHIPVNPVFTNSVPLNRGLPYANQY